jgi:hypothetical protein
MKIVTVQFDIGLKHDYKLLLDVFRESVRVNIPNAEFVELHPDPPKNTTGRDLYCYFNHCKLAAWFSYLKKTKDNIIFADCDMIALSDPSSVFDNDFDIGYTVRTSEGAGCPINGGIVIVKPSKASIDFMRLWARIDLQMMINKEFHDQYVTKYSGLNQSSFGYLLENPTFYDAKLKPFTTEFYNAVECDWINTNDKSTFVHIKTRLRRACLSWAKTDIEMQEPLRLRYPLERWKEIYRGMKCD